MILANVREGAELPTESPTPALARKMVQEKVRIRFRKEGLLRLLGHHDLMRVWDRLLRRTGLPLRFTEGFHPKPRVSSPLSLPLGAVGLEEIVEVELDGTFAPEFIRAKLEEQLVEGLSIASVVCLPSKTKTAVSTIEYAVSLPEGLATPALQQRIDELLAAPSCTIVRRTPGKPDRTVDLRPRIASIHLSPPELRFRLLVSPEGTNRPEEMLSALDLGALLAQGALLTRTRVELAEN